MTNRPSMPTHSTNKELNTCCMHTVHMVPGSLPVSQCPTANFPATYVNWTCPVWEVKENRPSLVNFRCIHLHLGLDWSIISTNTYVRHYSSWRDCTYSPFVWEAHHPFECHFPTETACIDVSLPIGSYPWRDQHFWLCLPWSAWHFLPCHAIIVSVILGRTWRVPAWHSVFFSWQRVLKQSVFMITWQNIIIGQERNQ